ncbi:MAG: hypothetical protein KDI28_07270 [Pseudomonadales bacterium]|nr:hypothetical protein [Pseudomonadales bacterium]MCP5357968.1 hypothetical protein [Pseudomonadales bacterium]
MRFGAEFGLLCALLVLPSAALAQHEHHMHAEGADGSRFDRTGMVMNTNTETLPQNCEQISADLEWTVRAGTRYALREAGRVFGYSQVAFEAPPCSRITVRFINEDAIRHQWMVHGLPRYLYPEGMFHLEASGGQEVQGTFIVPGDDATYLVHCDITQHMEKGMKGQLTVGRGNGDLWSIPGVTADFNQSSTNPRGTLMLLGVSIMLGMGVLTTTLIGKQDKTVTKEK